MRSITKNYLKNIFLLALIFPICDCWASSVKGSEKAKDKELVSIISKMNLNEKVGQMTQINIDVISVGELFNLDEPHQLDDSKLKIALTDYNIGSFLNAGGHAYSLEHWREVLTKIQSENKKQTRLDIPIIYGIDAIHGAGYLSNGTLFPQPLAQAATFNPELVKRGAEITAYETRACGIPWNFSPVLDLGRQPLWSRFFETYGEDVFLAKVMGKACVEGYQGDDPAAPTSVSSCLKHFLGYSYPFTGKDRTPVYLHERTLREYYLPTFEEAIDAGALSIMINSGELNGIPVHADKAILTDLLRNELDFDGVAITDWEDIMKLVNVHKVAPTLKDAVRVAVLAGVDISMTPLNYEFNDLLIELVEEGQVPMERIDESVYRVLLMKKRLGLFKDALSFNKFDYNKVASPEHAKASYETAAEGITLLKNENNLLPLSPNKTLAVTGVAANSRILINGAWTRTWQGTDRKYEDKSKPTVFEAFSKDYQNISFLPAYGEKDMAERPKLKEIIDNSDAIVVCLGEHPSTEKPGDIDELSFDEKQLKLVRGLAKTGKSIVLVLVENRPRLIREIEPLCDAIIMAYQPSHEGSQALVDIISGKVNPSGKLPFTYPKFSNTLLTYDHKHSERLDQKFGTDAFQPQFEFGDGLSYTNFEYSDLELSDTLLTDSKAIEISFKVTNSGDRLGKETALLFIADRFASITPSVKRLRGFDKKEIKPNETLEYSFKISAKDLAFVGHNNKWITEEGWFDIEVKDLKASFKFVK